MKLRPEGGARLVWPDGAPVCDRLGPPGLHRRGHPAGQLAAARRLPVVILAGGDVPASAGEVQAGSSGRQRPLRSSAGTVGAAPCEEQIGDQH